MINNVIIIGGGCAGLTAAIYCARAMLKPLVFADTYENKGGLLMKTSIVENYPGFPNGVGGFDLVDNMEKQAVESGATIINHTIQSVDLTRKPFTLTDSDGNNYLTSSIIICTGSRPRKLGLPSEDRFWTKGISSCAVCDGFLYKDRKIMVVGGGDTAAEEALFLSKYSNITLIHRRSELTCSKIMLDRLKRNDKIKIIYDTIIDELGGDDKLQYVVCKNLHTNDKTKIEVDGLFYGLGLIPNSSLFNGKLKTDAYGYIDRFDTDSYSTTTSVDGIFVAGDVSDKIYRQAIVACGDGCRAAMDVEKYLEHNIE